MKRSWGMPQERQIGRKCQNWCGRLQHGTSRGDNFWRKGRQDLPDNSCICAAKLHSPGSFFQALTFGQHTIQEQQDCREMAAGDHRVGTFETAPHRNWAGKAWLAKRGSVKIGASRYPHILRAFEQGLDLFWCDGKARGCTCWIALQTLLFGWWEKMGRRLLQGFLQRLGDGSFVDVAQGRNIG